MFSNLFKRKRKQDQEKQSGNPFLDMLTGAAAKCSKCGRTFTFDEGASLALEKGIKDQVVICPGCKSIYTVMLKPGMLQLLSDVTQKYK